MLYAQQRDWQQALQLYLQHTHRVRFGLQASQICFQFYKLCCVCAEMVCLPIAAACPAPDRQARQAARQVLSVWSAAGMLARLPQADSWPRCWLTQRPALSAEEIGTVRL